MRDAIASLRTLLSNPGDNLAALGTLIAIFVTATIILVLLLIAFVLPGSQEDDEYEDEAEDEEPAAPGPVETPEPDVEAGTPRRRRVFGALGCATAVVILLGGTGGALAYWYESTSTNEYCGTTCHEMLASAATYTTSAHTDVTCVQCHEGPKWTNLGDVIVKRGRYLYAGATGTDPIPQPFDEQTCVGCHRDVLTAELIARNGEPFLHSDVLEPGDRCSRCHQKQGHTPPR